MRSPVAIARTLRASGALDSPSALLKSLQFRQPLQRVTRSFHDYRWATALLLAHELGIFSLLAKRSHSPAEAAAALGAHTRSTEALMRILEAERLLVRRGDRYRLSPFASEYLVPWREHSLSPLLALLAAQASSFPDILRGMRDGSTPPALDIFNLQGRYRDFLDAVNDYLLVAARDFVSKVSLPDVRHMVMGSMGVSTSAVLLDHLPRARVTYGCLEHLVKEIPRLRQRYGVPPTRVVGTHEHGGNPSEDRWGDEAFDLVFLTKKMILAPEERLGQRFAEKAFRVLNPGGVAVFWECLHTDDRPTPLGRAMEAVMDLGASPCGTVSTEHGIQSQLSDIGFAKVEIVPLLLGELTFVVATKR